MGAAKTRGTKEQRIAVAIARDKILFEQARQKRIEEEKIRVEKRANMTPEEKQKEIETQKRLATIGSFIAMGMSGIR